MFPDQVALTAEELYEINTVTLCLLLHKVPSEIENESADALQKVIEIHNAIEELKAVKGSH